MDYKMPRLCFLGKQHGPLLFLFSGYPPICTLDAFYGCLQNVLGKILFLYCFETFEHSHLSFIYVLVMSI